MSFTLLALGSLFLSATLAQQAGIPANPLDSEPGIYSVGFELLEEHDHSRVVTGGNAATHPRPIRVYLWYPAEPSGRAMQFGRYAALADEDIWPSEIAGHMRKRLEYSRRPLARSLGSTAFKTLLQQPVAAREAAEPLKGPFPLIVIGQGLYYESPISFAVLAEHLAARGFVVATAPLVGTNIALVRVDLQDLETQVRDLEFVIARARELPFVSREKLGVLGFDQGGMAGVILTMRNRDVDAFMSLDSGILFEHPSGLPRTAPDYDPRALRVPWFHATGPYGARPATDSVSESLFEAAAYAERYLLVAEEMNHDDFTTYGAIEGRTGVFGYWQAATSGGAEGHRAVRRYAAAFFAAFLTESAESRASLSRAPEEFSPRSRMTLQHRPATRASITYEEFVQAVVAGQADQAIAELRAAAAVEPNHMLLDETYLQRLALSLLFTWQLAKEAVPVLELMAELHPTSDALLLLAESHIAVEDYDAAAERLSEYLERHPNDPRAQARLEWLGERQD